MGVESNDVLSDSTKSVGRTIYPGRLSIRLLSGHDIYFCSGRAPMLCVYLHFDIDIFLARVIYQSEMLFL